MNEAKNILKFVGGEENIVSVSHCITRLRFVLKDESLADVDELENIKVVKGTFTQAGQFQVIVGNNVSTVYKEMIDGTSIKSVSKAEVKEAGAQNLNALQRAMTYLAEIFAPIIPAIIVGGLILGFRNMMELPFGVLGDISLIEVNQFWAGAHSFLWLIGEAIFHYLPVYVTWSAYKRMGGTPVLGIVLGVCLVSPQLLNAYAVTSTEASSIPFWDFGFAQVEMIGYQAQVIPALLIGMIAGFVEVKLNKVVHSSISIIVVPFVVLVGGALLAHTVVGPFGWYIGTIISNVVLWMFDTLGFLGGIIFGFVYAPLVLTGLHHTTNAIDMQVIAETGTTPLWPLIALSNIAQGAAVFAMIFLQKSAKKRELSIPSTISAWLGVTEPAMFGVNLKYVFPFFAAMIGSACAGGFSILTGVTSNSIGVGGLPGIMSITKGSYFMFFIAMLIAVIIPFLLTVIMYKKKFPNGELSE